MIGQTFESVCQIAHVLFGILVTILAAYFIGYPLLGFIAVVLWSGFKELWWDMEYEDPAISGGFYGCIRDMVFYIGGGVIGYGLVWLHG